MTTPKSNTPQFASGTTVSVEQTEMQIRKMLLAYGATGYVVGNHQGVNMLAFSLAGYTIRFSFEQPREVDYEHNSKGVRQSRQQIKEATEKAHRVMWRELHLNIKSKLVMVHSKFRTVEQEFMPDIVLPNNMTVYEYSRPELRRMLESGEMPQLLPGGPNSRSLSQGEEA